jgi:hypothetical protein
MPNMTAQENIKQLVLDNPTEAAITCRPYGSNGALPTSDGVMRSFSSDGLYIETAYKYNSGTILIVRVNRYPSLPTSLTESERPRSICLAEVKWQRELIDENGIRFGMGLRYIY